MVAQKTGASIERNGLFYESKKGYKIKACSDIHCYREYQKINGLERVARQPQKHSMNGAGV